MIEELKKDLRLSVSKTKTYLDCQKKYKFSYVLKMPQKDNTYTIFGKFCHKVLEDFHLAYLAGSQELYNTVMTKAFKDALLEYKEKMTPEMKKECFYIINQYANAMSVSKNVTKKKKAETPKDNTIRHEIEQKISGALTGLKENIDVTSIEKK